MSAIKVILIFKKGLNLAWLVVLHDEFERPQKVLLEVEVLQLALLQKLQRQLPEVQKRGGYDSLTYVLKVLKNIGRL